MSGHHARPGTPPRHTIHHPATWAIAAAAISLLAVAACSSTATTTPSPTTSAVAAVNAGPGGHRPTLTGAGSTFDAPFFAVAFAKYQQLHPGVTISYAVVGSSAGIAAISAQQVDFGAADVPMNASELAAAKGGPMTTPAEISGAVLLLPFQFSVLGMPSPAHWTSASSAPPGSALAAPGVEVAAERFGGPLLGGVPDVPVEHGAG